MTAADGSADAPAVLVVGSTMVDMVAYTDRVPAPGETVHGRTFTLGFGGKGANQAVMARRLGADVTMVTCLGEDVFADMSLANFVDEGIDVTHVHRAPDVSSGVAPIWVEPDGTNRIIVVAGANEQLTQDQARTAIASAERVDVVLSQFELPQQISAAGFAAAREHGAVTVLNPAPAADIDPGLLALTDWLVPNEVEFAHLARSAAGGAGTAAGEPGAPAASDDSADDGDGPTISDATLLAVAASLGVRLVVTLGASGAALVGEGTVLRVPAPRVEAVDTTGAGDAFVGAFAYSLAAGRSEEEAVRLGCACASASVARPGTQASYPLGEALAALRRDTGAT